MGFVGKIKWILPFVVLGLIIVSPCYAQWFIETLDDGEQPSIAVDSSGYAHLCYSQGGKLRYATNASGLWVRETLDSGGNIISSSIALGLNDEPHIVYSQYDSNQKIYLLKYTKKLNNSWQPVEKMGESVGGYWSISLAIDSNGKLHISFMVASGPASSGVLFYGTDASGDWIVDQLETAYDYAAMDVDIENKAHISFYSTALGGLAYMTNASGDWQASELVDSVGGQLEGMVTSIAVISRPHICYVGGDMEDNRYATKNPDGSWFIGNLDHGDFASAGNSIAIDKNGYAHVSYYHMASGELRYQSGAKGPMGVGHSMRVDSGGWSNCIGVDPSGVAHIGYGASGKIKYATPAPDIAVSPESLDFGSIETGSASPPLELTVSNNGLANLIIGSIDITGVNAGEFSQANDCSTLVYEDSCTITVTFTPGSVGKKSATLNIASNDPDSPTVDVPLAGEQITRNNWSKTYGGSGSDFPNSVQSTADGGYIVAGWTHSFGAGEIDVWVLKLDANGNVEGQS